MQRLILGALQRFVRAGDLVVILPDGSRHEFGDGSGNRAALAVKDRRALWRLASCPSLGFAESFMDGDIEIAEGDLLDVLRIAFVNGDFDGASALRAVMRGGLSLAARWARAANTPGRARDNVRRHYDLPGELYRLFLDADMQYSCAYFEHEGRRWKRRNWPRSAISPPS